MTAEELFVFAFVVCGMAALLIRYYYAERWRHHRRVIEDIKREERREDG